MRTGRTIAALGAVVLATAATAGATDDAQAAVRAVVQSAYVEGVHAKGDPALMRAGFHPDFRMLTLRDGTMTALTLAEWSARIEKGARERSGPPPEVKAEFPLIEVAGNAAVVRVELHRGGRHAFTDFLSLYRFADGWKIVSKTFQAHP